MNGRMYLKRNYKIKSFAFQTKIHVDFTTSQNKNRETKTFVEYWVRDSWYVGSSFVGGDSMTVFEALSLMIGFGILVATIILGCK